MPGIEEIRFGEMTEIGDAGNMLKVTQQPSVETPQVTLSKKEEPITTELKVTEDDLKELVKPATKPTELENKVENKGKPEENIASSLDSLLPEVLKEEGVLEFTEEEFTNLKASYGEGPELLLGAIKLGLSRKVQQEFEEYKNKVEGEYKLFLESKKEGINPNELLGLQSLYNYHTGITEEMLTDNIELRKAILKEYYTRTTSMEEPIIDNLVDTEVKIEKDKLTAPKLLKSLIELDKYNLQELRNNALLEQENIKKTIDARKNEILSTLENLNDKEIIPGIKIKKDEHQKLLNMQMDIVDTKNNLNAMGVYRNKIGAFAFDTMLAKLIKEGVFEGKANTNIETSASSKAKRTLLELLESGDSNLHKRNTTNKPNQQKSTGSFAIRRQIG